jgi:DNA-binding beta-propeller fold protein YncE
MDPVHDEFIIANGFADAILFFRGDADGAEAPIRIIQGPSTLLGGPGRRLAVDPEHNEVFVTVRSSNSAIFVFPRDATGDVAPIRILRGPKTRLHPTYLAVDPINNLLVVGNNDPPGLLIFNRTDEGDVAPRAIITGPKTGIRKPAEQKPLFPIEQIQLYPPGKKIVVTVPSSTTTPVEPAFLGVWHYSDNGDVPAMFMLKGPSSMLLLPRFIALNPKDKEIYVADMGRNALLTFFWPQIFYIGNSR